MGGDTSDALLGVVTGHPFLVGVATLGVSLLIGFWWGKEPTCPTCRVAMVEYTPPPTSAARFLGKVANFAFTGNAPRPSKPTNWRCESCGYMLPFRDGSPFMGVGCWLAIAFFALGLLGALR